MRYIIGLGVYLAFFIVGTSSGLGADQTIPSPAEGSCNLNPIIRPTIQASMDLLPGLSTAVLVDRRVVMQRKKTPAGMSIQFTETAQLTLQSDFLNKIMTYAVNGMRSHAGETCQFSISTFEGSASWALPPTFQVKADGKGRKCTRFDYPCGLPEITCSGPFDCHTSIPMCESRQVFDLGNWSMSVPGTLPLGVNQNTQTIALDASRGTPVVDTGGSGEIADILSSVGLLKLFQNIDTSLRVDVNLGAIPSIGRLIETTTPTDPVASARQLDSANWTKISNTHAGQYSNIGIGYVQTVALFEKSGCIAAKCLRKSPTDEQYAICFYGKED